MLLTKSYDLFGLTYSTQTRLLKMSFRLIKTKAGKKVETLWDLRYSNDPRKRRCYTDNFSLGIPLLRHIAGIKSALSGELKTLGHARNKDNLREERELKEAVFMKSQIVGNCCTIAVNVACYYNCVRQSIVCGIFFSVLISLC